MTRRYAKPPIVEVLCQFNFNANPLDWTVPGLLYGELGHLYPQKSGQIQSTLVGVKQGDGTPVGSEIPKLRLRFAGEGADAAWLVQAEPDVLIVHYVPQTDVPYRGWDVFQERVIELMNTFNDIAKADGIAAAALRYINRIELPRSAPGDEPLSIDAYLRPGLDLDGHLRDGRDVTFDHRYTMRCETPPGTLVLQTASVALDEGKAGTHVGFGLDIEFNTQFDEPPHLSDDMPSWLDAAHDVASEMFEKCITDKARELFEVMGGDAE
jgi:uncharacterized protein (TIGR04255 family)